MSKPYSVEEYKSVTFVLSIVVACLISVAIGVWSNNFPLALSGGRFLLSTMCLWGALVSIGLIVLCLKKSP